MKKIIFCLCLLLQQGCAASKSSETTNHDTLTVWNNPQPNLDKGLVYSVTAGCKSGKVGSDAQLTAVVMQPKDFLALASKETNACVQNEMSKIVSIVRCDVQGLPKDQSFWLYTQTVTNVLSPLAHFTQNEKGEWVSGRVEQRLTDFPFCSSWETHLPGEPICFVLVSDDGKIILSERVVPLPLITVAEDGAKFGVEIVSNRPECIIYGAYCEGFKPEESCLCNYFSEHEVAPTSPLLMTGGKAQMMIMPKVIGKTGGTAGLSIIRTGGETLSLTFKWGDQLVTKRSGSS